MIYAGDFYHVTSASAIDLGFLLFSYILEVLIYWRFFYIGGSSILEALLYQCCRLLGILKSAKIM